MRQAIHQHRIVTYAISLGLMTAYMSLFQPIPSASAQQLIGTVSQGTSGTGTQGRRIENMAPTLLYRTKSLEKKDAQTLTRKPHRLIRKPQNAPVASVAPSPSGSSPVSSVPTPPPSLQSDSTTSQSKELSSLSSSVGAAVPLATMSVAPSSATTSGTIAVGTASAGTIPLAAAGAGSSSTSGIVFSGGRSMSRLAAEMPGLAQLISPPSLSVAPPLPSTPTPTIGLSPLALSFSAVQNSTAPASQSVAINNAGTGTLTWTASSNMAWLRVNGTASVSGTNTGTLAVTVSTTGLSLGPQSGMITLTASGTTNTPQNIPVTFTITVAPTPTIGLSSTNLSFTGVQGGTSPADQTVTINNSGSGTLTWTASGSASWLSISPTSGSVPAGLSNTLSVSVSTTGLAASTVSTPIMISAAGATNTPQTITASLTVTAQPALGLSPTTFSFTATQGAANPAPKTLNVTNPGTGTLTWSVTNNPSWLTLTPASGTTTTGTSPVTLSVNTLGLLAGPVTAAITVTAGTTTNSPQTIPVTLTVSASTTSSATLTWTPNTDADLAGYKIYQRTASGAYGAALATVPAGTVTYQATGLLVNTTYSFVITAYDSAGNESLFSNEVSKSIL